VSSNAGRLGWIAGLLLAGYGCLCLLAFLYQRRLLYFPIRWSEEEARRSNPGFEQLFIPTPDGQRLHAWLLRQEKAPWTVVIFHGNAGNLSFHQDTLVPFQALGLQAILFDYRGYGLSSGHPTEEGLLIDGEAVVEYARTSLKVAPDRIVYFGQSLGSGVAALLAGRHPPARLILQSGYPSLADVAAFHYPFLPVKLLMLDRFEDMEAIRHIACPLLMLHPSLDEIIPVDFGRALFEQAIAPKHFILLPGAHHNDVLQMAPQAQIQAIGEFLDLRSPSSIGASPGS
jgi:fermentation-respiration switch protein FrsA (DUF1100 family)